MKTGVGIDPGLRLSRPQQRALVQPYIMAMQLFALALMLSRHRISSDTLLSVTLNLPALIAAEQAATGRDVRRGGR